MKCFGLFAKDIASKSKSSNQIFKNYIQKLNKLYVSDVAYILKFFDAPYVLNFKKGNVMQPSKMSYPFSMMPIVYEIFE